VSVAGIACVRHEALGRLQIRSQTFAGRRRKRGENPPTGRDGDDARRSLRLLLVMHLHGRHEAHLTLQTPLKQARQSLAALARRRRAEGFPYAFRDSFISRDFNADFVKLPLHAVTLICQIR